MRWLLLVVIVSCAKNNKATVKQDGGSADATAESSNADYVYNVYQFSDELIQDWGETNQARFFTRLKLTADGYPDTVHIAIAFDPDQDGEVGDGFKEMEKIRWSVRPMPITSLPGMYILPFTSLFPMGAGYHVYMSWDHANQQVSKVMLVVSTGIVKGSCTTTQDGERSCQESRKGGLVFAEAERMPYDQATAKKMYLERKTPPSPADQWSILDMVAFDQMISLYQLTGSPEEDLELSEEESLVVGESAHEKLKRLAGLTDKVVDNFLKTSGVHATEGMPKTLK